MSNALAIAAVTAVLKDLLNNGLTARANASVDFSAAIGTFNVTAISPDLITTGTSEPAQLNLFMYNVTENPGWRNAGFPLGMTVANDFRSAAGSQPPLSLDGIRRQGFSG